MELLGSNFHLFAVIVILLFFSSFFSSSETAFFSLQSFDLQKIRKKTGGYLYDNIVKLLSSPRQLIITILMGNEVVNILISMTVASLYSIYLIDKPVEYVLLASIFTTAVLLLIFGEITPKIIAFKLPHTMAKINVLPLSLIFRILHPFSKFILVSTDKLVTLLIGEKKPSETAGFLSEKDFLNLVDAGEYEGEIEGDERDLIHNVFDFGDTVASSVMTNKKQLFLLPLKTTYGEILESLANFKYSRIPVYSKDRDNIVGVLHIKSLLRGFKKAHDNEDELDLSGYMTEPYFVPPTKPLINLFYELKKGKKHLAIVVNEYGKPVGIVTMDDILRKVFGDIKDERDVEE